MGCGGSKEAVATGNAGSRRCNRNLFRRKSSVAATAVHQPSREPLPSDNVPAAIVNANDEVVTETKDDKAITLTKKAIDGEKGEGINNKADQIVKGNREAFTVKEGKAKLTVNAIWEKKDVEIKKDEAVIKDEKELVTVVKGKEAPTEKKQEEAKKDKAVKDKEEVADQKNGVVSTENVIVEEKDEDMKNDGVVKISTEAAMEERKNEGGHKDNDEAASTENDVEESFEEDDSVTFPVAPVTEDESIGFMAASETKEDGSVTFEAAPEIKDEDDSVTFAAAPVTKDEYDSVTFAAAPVAKVEEVAEQPEPSEHKEQVKNEAELPESTVVTVEEVVTEVDGAAETEDVAEQPKPSEENEEVKNEEELPEPIVVDEVVTELDKAMQAEEEKLDTVEEIKVKQEEKSVPQEPEEKKPSAALTDEGRLDFLDFCSSVSSCADLTNRGPPLVPCAGVSDGKQTVDLKEAITTEKGEELAVPEKNDEEKAATPSESAMN
ncbi:uncharacterized protein LOC133886387 [Phragmites australis]|uniref:uncharacterized protein LOC133886387 n=1 Tax=Phragmites australis TaxID=29695 RepID=UPI002D768E66|nr:uncharacterized protein LOC133886387 [Phragmites australis]